MISSPRRSIRLNGEVRSGFVRVECHKDEETRATRRAKSATIDPMSPRGRPPDPPPIEIRKFTAEEAEWAIGLLSARVGEVKALDPETVSYRDERVRAVERRIRGTILEVFGENSVEYRQDHQYHEIRGGRPISV